MILSGQKISSRLGKDIFIEPYNEEQLNLSRSRSLSNILSHY
ncbi:hypothetical protein AN1V17_21950 [Vallitalea sediminicola]